MQFSLLTRVGAVYVAIGALLRIQLIRSFGPQGVSSGTWIAMCLAGAALDALVAVVVVSIPSALAALLPGRFRARHLLRDLAATAACSVLIYEAAIEYFFFDEFNARFNRIAVDYVAYPHEVIGNLWQTFDIGRYAFEAVLGGMLIAAFIAPRVPRVDPDAAHIATRVRSFAFALLAGLGAGVALWSIPGSVVEDRVANEVALNGPVQLMRAVWNASLSYGSFYLTHPRAEARARAAAVLEFPKPTEAAIASPDFRLVRHVTPLRATPLRSIVVVLEESLGSEFVGCLGASQHLTPEFDRWSHEGLLLSNLFATGNRTVRGLESVLCSMVPLPGDSIVKRGQTDRVDGLPTILGRAGYQTAFFYGGRGVFDNLKSFAAATGYQSFHEQSDYPKTAFTTAWGVADEYIFDAALERQLEAKRSGKKLFATILTVSNHKPFLVPPEHAPSAAGRNRHTAIRYADWALGRWLAALRKHGLLEDTAVLIVGDHGARVYGSERIPIRSYRVPGLFIVPDARWHDRRIGRLCSQVDLAGTLLSLAGVECDVPFFGTTIVDRAESGGRAFVQHNYDLGMLDDDKLVILGLRRAATTYRRLPDDSLQTEGVHAALERDASAVYQTAEEQYEAGRLSVGHL